MKYTNRMKKPFIGINIMFLSSDNFKSKVITPKFPLLGLLTSPLAGCNIKTNKALDSLHIHK